MPDIPSPEKAGVERVGETHLPDRDQFLDEVFDAAMAIPGMHARVLPLVHLSEAGHPSALDEAIKIATTPREIRYADRPSGISIGDIDWYQDYEIAHVAGAVAKRDGFEAAFSLAGNIQSELPRARALINIGKEGYPSTFKMALTLIDPVRQSEKFEEVAHCLVEQADTKNLEELQPLLEASLDYMPSASGSFQSLLVKAYVKAEDLDKAHELVDELLATNNRIGISTLLEMARAGDELALAKALKHVRSNLLEYDGIFGRAKNEIELLRIMEQQE